VTVVDLHPQVVAGSVTFSNRLLRLTPGLGAPGPIWQMNPQPAQLIDREPNVIHASFEPIAQSYDGSFGSLYENEHGLNGSFYFAPPFFDLLQQAALSAADLELSVIFAARAERVESLSLTLNHKTA
jgi:hypothetical protein